MRKPVILAFLVTASTLVVSATPQQANNFFDFTATEDLALYGKITVSRKNGAPEVTIVPRDSGKIITVPEVIPQQDVDFCEGTKFTTIVGFALGSPTAPPKPGFDFRTKTNTFGFIKVIVFDGATSCDDPLVSQIIVRDRWLIQPPGEPPPPLRTFTGIVKKPQSGVPYIDTADPETLLLTFTDPAGNPAGGVFIDIPGTALVEANKKIIGLDLLSGQIKWQDGMQGTRDLSFKTFIRCACGAEHEFVAVVHWDATVFVQAGATEADSFGQATGTCALVTPVPQSDIDEYNTARAKAGKPTDKKVVQATFYIEEF